MKDKKRPYILAVNGSPRRDGNTEILLDKMIEGARTHKIEVDKIYPSDLEISPCRECYGCDKTGRCVIEDDMQALYPKLMEADYLIFASPIFFYSVTAWAKAVIDRVQPQWVEKYLLKKEKRGKTMRPGFIILVGATRGEKLFEGAELTLKYFFDAIDVETAGKFEICGVDEKGEILNHPDTLDEAYKAGVEFIRPPD